MSQIWTGYNDVTNVTGIGYENAKNRVLCVSLLTTAKLTRSCADQYTGAINYTQFTTDIAWEVNERCKRLALEHHKCDKMRTPKACDAGCHAKTSVTPRRGSPCGCPRGLHLSPRSARRARAALVLPAHAYRVATRAPARWGQIVPRNIPFPYLLRVRMGQMGLQADTKECVLATTDVPSERETAMILTIPWHRAGQKRD